MTEVKPQVLVCREGRKPMTLEERLKHFEVCKHPQCVALLAKFDQIAKYVEENLDNKKVK